MRRLGWPAARVDRQERIQFRSGGLSVNNVIRRFLFNRDVRGNFLANLAQRGKIGLRALGFLFALILCCGSAWAQKDTGVIAGTVRDASGAVVAGAKVRVKDIDHGTEFDTTTEPNGEYVAGPL